MAGHDWGAIVAWEMAKMRPERIEAVVGMSIPDRFAEPQDPAQTPIPALRTARGEAFYLVQYRRSGFTGGLN
ncbi:alpha/beta fold hydrolase [Streptomyces litchfieldiae]|uniref:Alpha/beta hydrolase n=1 Tax=Streptomyces litchfieldiae TaxID=3075543 RepID=A0ABU2MV18_9ACTN|nr:alpha/beta hydrolase [Streptomyces sp. DSM 44938]MDT0345485.1 alpha/beta hydrolase [Streptomyces sp. DSM 44938]